MEIRFRDQVVDTAAARAAARVFRSAYENRGDPLEAMGAALDVYDSGAGGQLRGEVLDILHPDGLRDALRVWDHYIRLDVTDRTFVMGQAVVGYLQWLATYERAELVHARRREGRA